MILQTHIFPYIMYKIKSMKRAEWKRKESKLLAPCLNVCFSFQVRDLCDHLKIQAFSISYKSNKPVINELRH